jgi:hypothetical protein
LLINSRIIRPARRQVFGFGAALVTMKIHKPPELWIVLREPVPRLYKNLPACRNL